MTAVCRTPSVRFFAIAAIAVIFFQSGCRNWDADNLFRWKRETPSETADTNLPPTPDSDHWGRRVAKSEDHSHTRWRHPELEAAIAAPAERRPDFVFSLASEKEVQAANAAIGLARLGSDQGARVLARTVNNTELRVELRAAAMEALASLPTTKVEALSELATHYQDFDGDVIYIPELHAELLVGLARRPTPSLAIIFQRGLQSPSPEARLAAVYAWRDARLGPLPAEIASLRGDADPRVRAAMVLLTAARGEPDALNGVRRALSDSQIEVRVAAVRALAEIQSPEAVALAKQVFTDPSEALRAEAVTTLCALGAREETRAAAKDTSWRVRQAFAKSLATGSPAEWSAAAVALLADASVEVQQAAVAAIDRWPSEACEPLLLKAMEQNALLTRKSAAARLARRWGEAGAFVADAAAKEREETLRRLREQWQALHPSQELVDAAVQLVSHQYPEIPAAIDEINRVRGLLEELDRAQGQPDARRQILALLRAEGERLPVVLEFLVKTEGRRLADDVYIDALSQVNDVFRSIEELKSDDVETRRRAAIRLGEIAATIAVKHLVAGRVASLCVSESDPQVWRALFAALGEEFAPNLLQLFSSAMGHPSPEVRRMACAHFEIHGDVSVGPLLLKALDDPNPAVVLAAVKALACAPGAIDAGPLERLLVCNDKNLRVEVATSLLRMGESTGADALERLAHDDDPQIRLLAAQRMAESLDPVFTATLIGMLDDSLGVRQAAISGLHKLHREQEAVMDRAEDLHTQATAWKNWWKSRPSSDVKLR